MMDIDLVSAGIVDGVGGPGNIRSIGHCTTRLRMVLADRGLADRDAVRALPGIMSTVERGGQFQVVVGHEVGEVENRVREIVLEGTGGAELEEAPPGLSFVDRAFDLFMGTFQPLLWALVGASMVRLMLSLGLQLGWIDPQSGTYAVWAAAGNALFALFPVFVAITASRKLGANPYVGGAIGAALVDGTLADLSPEDPTTFLGIRLEMVDYSSSVFPALLAAVALSVLEKWLKRLLPRDLHLVAIPAICLIVIVPMTVLALGPIGTLLGHWIAGVVTTLNDFSPVLTGALYAAGFMFMVMLGLHWATMPAILAGMAADGSDPLPAYMGAANFAVFGIAFGVAMRSRDRSLRQLGFSGMVTGLLAGISEPTVYGILLRFRRTLPIMVVAAAAGGALLGLLGVESTAFVFSSVFTIPAFEPVGGYVLGITVAFTLAAGLVGALGYEDRRAAVAVAAPGAPAGAVEGAVPAGAVAGGEGAGSRETTTTVSAPALDGTPTSGAAGPTAGPVASSPRSHAPASSSPTHGAPSPSGPAGTHRNGAGPGSAPGADVPGSEAPAEVGALRLMAPLSGTVVALAEVADPLFAKGMLGPGVAIQPSGGLVRAPADGTVTSVARTSHALSITTSSGADVVIHLGIDTVHLSGRHFDVLVSPGQHVVSGQPVAHMDIAALVAEGYDPTTPVIVTNARALGRVEVVDGITGGAIRAGDPLLQVQPSSEPATFG